MSLFNCFLRLKYKSMHLYTFLKKIKKFYQYIYIYIYIISKILEPLKKSQFFVITVHVTYYYIMSCEDKVVGHLKMTDNYLYSAT